MIVCEGYNIMVVRFGNSLRAYCVIVCEGCNIKLWVFGNSLWAYCVIVCEGYNINEFLLQRTLPINRMRALVLWPNGIGFQGVCGRWGGSLNGLSCRLGVVLEIVSGRIA